MATTHTTIGTASFRVASVARALPAEARGHAVSAAACGARQRHRLMCRPRPAASRRVGWGGGPGTEYPRPVSCWSAEIAGPPACCSPDTGGLTSISVGGLTACGVREHGSVDCSTVAYERSPAADWPDLARTGGAIRAPPDGSRPGPSFGHRSRRRRGRARRPPNTRGQLHGAAGRGTHGAHARRRRRHRLRRRYAEQRRCVRRERAADRQPGGGRDTGPRSGAAMDTSRAMSTAVGSSYEAESALPGDRHS